MIERIDVLGPTYLDQTINLKDPISLDGSSRIEDEKSYPGGTGLCYAVALNRLGNHVTLHTAIGNDSRGDQIRDQISLERNITPEWQIVEGSTDYAYILVDRGNHKAVASRKDASNKFNPSKIERVSNAKAVVITSFQNGITSELLRGLREKEVQKPFVMWAPHMANCIESTQIKEQLDQVDHITLSRDEFNALRQAVGNPIDCGVSSITVTNGKSGCDLITPNGMRHFSAIYAVENPIDTNGAGEAFGSGFLTTYLKTGDYEKAIRAGSYVGFLHIHRPGSDFPHITSTELLSFASYSTESLNIKYDSLVISQHP